ncbi:MAG: hypothetical protein ABSE45_07690 [Candidatus Acidiferrales bacterium]
MSNSSLAIHSGRGVRRSTRLNRAIPLVVAGVDSFRGPYQEEVSTITVSCHGCLYESKNEVLPDQSVLLELNGKGPGSKAISTRGRVKWTMRPTEPGGLFRTAIELETPGNIWGVDSPPGDWVPYVTPRPAEAEAPKAKPVSVLRPEAAPAPATTKDDRGRAKTSHGAESNSPAPSATRPVSQLMGGFQQQMEQMLSDAAEVAVRDRTASLLDGVRAELQEDVKRILAEATASQSSDWMDESLKRMNQVAEESARTRHAQWTKKVETELQQAIARMEARHRELEELSERLTKSAHERLESAFEVGRTEAVGRIVARLKEQSAPVIDNALKVVADLTKREEEMEKICQQFAEKSAVQIEETCTRLDKQFEMILRERLDSAREELDRAASAASSAMLHNLRASAQQYESEAQARLQVALAPATETALASLQEKAAEISRQFAGELSHYSRSHLEFVGGAISDLAKGIGKLSKD